MIWADILTDSIHNGQSYRRLSQLLSLVCLLLLDESMEINLKRRCESAYRFVFHTAVNCGMIALIEKYSLSVFTGG